MKQRTHHDEGITRPGSGARCAQHALLPSPQGPPLVRPVVVGWRVPRRHNQNGLAVVQHHKGRGRTHASSLQRVARFAGARLLFVVADRQPALLSPL